MYNRKDFVKIADLLKSLVNVDKKELYEKFYKAEFSKNPRFNETRFLKACGVNS
jgi:hypothetical protein